VVVYWLFGGDLEVVQTSIVVDDDVVSWMCVEGEKKKGMTTLPNNIIYKGMPIPTVLILCVSG